MNLKRFDQYGAWRRLLINLSVSKSQKEGVWEDLVRRYTEDGRYYHTLDHVKAVLFTLAELEPLAEDYLSLQLAAWFHDIIYNPRAANNELQSGRYADSVMAKMGLARERIDKVTQMIVATGRHLNTAKEPDTYLLLDADLAIFGSEERKFDRYCRDIRKEYGFAPEELYRRKRVEILRGFLERPRIYHTPLLYDRLEKRARENLGREIGRLSS